MGNPVLGWSLVQLRLANQAKVQPIGRISNLVVDIEGMKTHVDFDVIEIVEDGGSYPALLGNGWDNDSMVVINFKKRFMTLKTRMLGSLLLWTFKRDVGILNLRGMKPVEVGITPIISLNIIFTRLLMVNSDGVVLVLCHPIPTML